MQLELQFQRSGTAAKDLLTLGSQILPLLLVRNQRARRYILRVRLDGTVRLTIPRGGSKAGGLEFLTRHVRWVEQHLQKVSTRARRNTPAWTHGTQILYRGELVPMLFEPGKMQVRFADQVIAVSKAGSDLRPLIEAHLRRLATLELRARTLELAALRQLSVARVLVRDQRSRWGSCSARKTISLTWRLIQAPAFVRDYLIWHELMHLKEMNHSPRFWRLVQEVCPNYALAEKWLKNHEDLLPLRL